MSEVTDPWVAVEQILRLFYPQYFSPDHPDYVEPGIMQQLDIIAQEARPWCLSEAAQNMAEAMYLAYLISLRSQSSSGATGGPGVAGPVLSEKEGDIAVTYADLTKTGTTTSAMSRRPSSDPWDAWNRLWMRCAAGAITTRFGDPCRSGGDFTLEAVPRAVGVWQDARNYYR